MSNPRISVSQLKQLIQLRANQMTTRSIARALSLSQGAVSKYGRAVLASCQTWEAALVLEETELERRVFAERRLRPAPTTTDPDCAWIHTEMKRHKHVTLQLLWEEYCGVHGAAALRYSAFCERYRQWARRLQRSMRQRHFAGEKLFVDYAGRTVPIYGASCEEAFRAALFVGALGASGYAYAEATRTATLPDWLGSHVRMLEFYEGSPTILVPDNPRVGVTKADRYEPELQRSYEEMAGHFGIAVIPARPYRPKDKPKAELTVLLVCRWILARLRHQRFFSLDELNAAIRPLLDRLNDRPFQKLPGSRRSMFESLDRPAMRTLPAGRYVYAEWKRVRAAFDYHVEIDRHYYSIPHALVGQELWARFTAATVEVFHCGQRVGSHVRLALSPQAPAYYEGLLARRFNARVHLRKILALGEIYGRDACGRAIQDALVFNAFSSEYIAHLLESRARTTPVQASPLFLTRRADLLELELPPPDLSIYEVAPHE